MHPDSHRSDAERMLARLKATLSQAETEVLLLSAVEGLSEEDTAQVLHRPVLVVRALLQQARRKAGEVLAADGYRPRR